MKNIDENIVTGSALEKYIIPEKEYSRIQNNRLYITTMPKEDNKYVRVAEICAGCKIYSVDEDELYEIDKKLNELGYETRVGRNMYTGDLSIAVLENPKVEGDSSMSDYKRGHRRRNIED